MRQRGFGGTGRDVAVIGQGTWRLDDDDRARALAALRAGLDAGMTHIDTAEMYGDVEPLVAEAIAGRRETVFLVSKVLPSNASRAGTIAACERSLQRLGTDRLDGYLLHWPGSHPLEETIAGFETLKASGKILSWGLSNFDVDGLDAVLHLAGPGAIACNQVLYHLQERAIEHAVAPWCRRNGVALVAYSPFGSGAFPDPGSRGGRVLAGIAEAHATTPHAVALAFLTRHDGVFAIPKTASRERAVANATAGDLVLSAPEIAALDAAFPRGPRPRHLPML
ncbi:MULTISPECIES: aldo/keto reductase [unclassified Methylobacterium]|uniref:aldo/keto reductase n=1 Tax=unclassified Methylobacterium TaxID=2615210 RepID=UPI0006F6C898|nr:MULTISPECIES: aldo/keto reductase [unclassified Methylobacterium]KQO73066.1 oxidoreductase [Methylobacterium sp. Leaf87]KQP32358.1 oxidoreductase [Methylobacterium sp. Leaf100]